MVDVNYECRKWLLMSFGSGLVTIQVSQLDGLLIRVLGYEIRASQ